MRPNGHGEDFRLHFAGCSSSCAQHQIADVGIEGVLKKVDGEFVEAMDIRIGGRLGENPQFGDVVIKKVPHWELNETLLRIFTLYETQPRRGRDVPRLRGPHRARVVDAGADAGRRTGRMSVTEVLAQAVERHHPRLVMLCSFQKEESVLVDELVRLAPDARIVTIDTGVLFPETLATWRAFEERFGVDVEIEDATGDWTGPAHCCGDAQGRRARARAGRRRRLDHRHPPRAVADARGRAAGRVRRQARDLEVQPARRVDREGPVAADPRARPARTTRCTTRATRRSAARRARTRAPAARAAGPGLTKTECGLHV